MSVLNLTQVKKYYKGSKDKPDFEAIKNLDLSIFKGQIVGLVGPNGAGKSTTIKMISGILRPTSGSITVCGKCPIQDRNKVLFDIGVVFGNRSSLWFNLPGIDSLHLIKDIYNIEDKIFEQRLKLYGEILEVESILNKPVRNMSLGEKMKIEILASILHHPKLLILDEPTLGLDIIAKRNFRLILKKLSEVNEIAVLLTTHDLVDVEKICDRVVFINHGEKKLDFNNCDFEKMFSHFSTLIIDGHIDDPILNNYKVETNNLYSKYLIETKTKDEALNALRKYDVSYKIEKISMEDLLSEYYHQKF